MIDRPGFFRTLARTLYDFSAYQDVVDGGVRGALGYLAKLALLTALILVAISTIYERHYFRTVVQPQIDGNVKPAFADSPALEWKEGVLTADGTIPFKVSVEFLDRRIAFIVDTSDDPDTSPLHQDVDEAMMLTSTHMLQFIAEKDEDVRRSEYGSRYDGTKIAAGEAYRFQFGEPPFNLMFSAMKAVMAGVQLLIVMVAASVVVSGLGLMAVPDARRLGIMGTCSVAAHAMSPAVAAFLVVLGLLLATAPDPERWPLWLLFAAPFAVAVTYTYLALKACVGDAPRPEKRKPGPVDDDLLPPDQV